MIVLGATNDEKGTQLELLTQYILLRLGYQNIVRGAQNVIATLWPVEDRSTARLMEHLHVRLRAGESEAPALAQAQRQMLRDPRTADPFYWAGFTLVGGR